jgi:hypothetical protein
MPWEDTKYFELNLYEAARAPDDSGIFGLKNHGEWVYIASSNNIRQALLSYLEGNMPWIAQQRPIQFAYELVDGARRTLRCSQLTAEYRPVFLNCVGGLQ